MVFLAHNESSESNTDAPSQEEEPTKTKSGKKSTPETSSEEQSDRRWGETLRGWGKTLQGILTQDVKDETSQPPAVPLWLLLLLVIITISLVHISLGMNIPGEQPRGVPWPIYIIGGLGTLAYLFSNIATNQVRTFTPLQALTRIGAAFPVALGVYILAQFLLSPSLQQGFPLLGVVFLSGFALEIFVQAFNLFAQRLLGLPEIKDSRSVPQRTRTSSPFAEPITLRDGIPITPVDHDGDGLFEDLTGDGNTTEQDVAHLSQLVAAYQYNEITLTQSQIAALDFNGDGQLTLADIIAYIQQYLL